MAHRGDAAHVAQQAPLGDGRPSYIDGHTRKHDWQALISFSRIYLAPPCTLHIHRSPSPRSFIPHSSLPIAAFR